jgi:hypothetical protein
MQIRVIRGGQHVDTVSRKSFTFGRKKRAVRYRGKRYGVTKSNNRFYIHLESPIGGRAVTRRTSAPRPSTAKKSPIRAWFEAQKNPGIPWWVWVIGGGALLYYVTQKSAKATTPGGLTMKDLEQTVYSKMKAKATNIKGSVDSKGIVTVTGKYGGNTSFTFIKANSMTEAFKLSQKLSGENPAVVGKGLSGLSSYGLGYLGVGSYGSGF